MHTQPFRTSIAEPGRDQQQPASSSHSQGRHPITSDPTISSDEQQKDPLTRHRQSPPPPILPVHTANLQPTAEPDDLTGDAVSSAKHTAIPNVNGSTGPRRESNYGSSSSSSKQQQQQRKLPSQRTERVRVTVRPSLSRGRKLASNSLPWNAQHLSTHLPMRAGFALGPTSVSPLVRLWWHGQNQPFSHEGQEQWLLIFATANWD